MISGFVWEVPAAIIRWKDGDTCEVKIDCGWRHSIERESVRVLHLWCEETDDPDPVKRSIAGEQLAHAYELAPPGLVVKLTSKALSKGGLWTGAQQSLSRTLGDLRLPDGRDFAQTMEADGFGSRSPLT